jgi:hypothetical protein
MLASDPLRERFILPVEMRVELANCLRFATIRVTSADWFVLVDTASYFSPAAEDFQPFAPCREFLSFA